ncbi:MAG: hypothetical protein ABSC55_14925 [Syntrophorhabdales bacterium]
MASKRWFGLALAVLMFFASSSIVLGWAVNTHVAITDTAMSLQVCPADSRWYQGGIYSQGNNWCWNLDTYLRQANLLNYLGFGPGGLSQQIPGMDDTGQPLTFNNQPPTVQQWIEKGAKDEDSSVLRSWNHYHNPLQKDWSQAGLHTVLFRQGQSSVVWAQLLVGEQAKYGTTDFPFYPYSWEDAREYYYRALTATNDADRNNFFGKTFAALGHVMHLIEDAAVPDHTRNHVHGEACFWPLSLLGATCSIEDWADRDVNAGIVSSFLATASGLAAPDPTFGITVIGLDSKPNQLATIPIAQVFDTGKYVGTNPDATAPKPETFPVGIAEYSNANFVSKGTIFTQEYPYPSQKTSVGTNSDDPDYLMKIGDGESNIPHFVRVNKGLMRYWSQYDLDDKCYNDHAALLIPRAARYASVIPYYFFRGQLTAVSSGDNNHIYVANGSDERMYNGKVTVLQNINGQWEQVGNELTPVPDLNTGGWIDTGISVTNGISAIVVYRGGLGRESDAVVGTLRLYLDP